MGPAYFLGTSILLWDQYTSLGPVFYNRTEFFSGSNEGLDEKFRSVLRDYTGAKVTMETRDGFILLRNFPNHSTAARHCVAVRRGKQKRA